MELKFVTPISLCVFIMEEGGVDDPIFFTIRKKTGRVTHHFRVGPYRYYWQYLNTQCVLFKFKQLRFKVGILI